MKKILIIEDNLDMAKLLELHLSDAGFGISLVHDGLSGFRLASEDKHGLIILDIMLPEMDGLEVCQQLRGRNITTPILMLTAKGTEIDRVLGLEIGADDYLTKPFSVREMIARVKALMRRSQYATTVNTDSKKQTIESGNIKLNSKKREVLVNNKSIDLTAKEFDLLWHFSSHPGQVFSRSQLLDQIWGYGHDGYEHTVNSHINRLRSKIEIDPAKPDHILTVWGVGYKYTDQPAI